MNERTDIKLTNMRHLGIRDAINSRIEELRHYQRFAKTSSELKDAGRVKITVKPYGYQYYLINKGTNSPGKYVPRKDEGIVKAILQDQYNEKLDNAISHEIEYLENVLNDYDEDAIPGIYSNLHPGRKSLVSPVDMDDEDYAIAWQKFKYERKPILEGRPYFETLKGEKVRSKSEAIIADTLMNRGVPYHYEMPLQLKHGVTFHPDFTVVNVRTRKTYYLEHLGMLDDRGYLSDAINRIDIYEDNGIALGDSLLITYETERRPLQRKRVDFLIDRFLV